METRNKWGCDRIKMKCRHAVFYSEESVYEIWKLGPKSVYKAKKCILDTKVGFLLNLCPLHSCRLERDKPSTREVERERREKGDSVGASDSVEFWLLFSRHHLTNLIFLLDMLETILIQGRI
jgi:hypothetical protein